MLYLVLGIIFAIIIGILGIFPSLHINNILPIIYFTPFSPDLKVIIIIISSTIFSIITFIPTAFISVPSTDSYISTTSLQKLYVSGKAYYGIYLATIGAIYGLFFGFIFIIIYVAFVNSIEPALKYITPFILIITLYFLLKAVKNKWGYFSLVFASTIGIIVFFGPYNIKNPLFPMIIGFFGLSNLVVSLSNPYKKIPQTIYIKKTSFLIKILIGFIATLASIVVSLFPGIGSGIATYFSGKITKIEDEYFIMLNGAINTEVIILSIYSSLLINKTRTGTGLILIDFLEKSIYVNVFTITLTIFFAIILGVIITLWLAKKMIKYNLEKIREISIILIFIFSVLFSNFTGFLILILTTIVGVFNLKSNNPRILLLSSITVPVLITYLFLF